MHPLSVRLLACVWFQYHRHFPMFNSSKNPLPLSLAPMALGLITFYGTLHESTRARDLGSWTAARPHLNHPVGHEGMAAVNSTNRSCRGLSWTAPFTFSMSPLWTTWMKRTVFTP